MSTPEVEPHVTAFRSTDQAATTDPKAETLIGAAASARAQVNEILDQTSEVAAVARHYVRERPVMSVGIALAVGVLTGLIMGRSR